MQFSSFSKKFNRNSGILQLMNDLGQAANNDQDICMLGGGNPASIPEMEKIFREEMEDVLKQERKFENMIGSYDSPQGNERFINNLSEMLIENYGWNISHKNIAVTNGSQASFGIIFNLLSGQFNGQKNKKILLPLTPEYIGYNDVGLSDQPLFTANKPIIQNEVDNNQRLFKYRVDFNNLEIQNDINAICVSRPTNPTGNVITDNELNTINQLALSSGIPLIIDGAYGLPFPGIIFSNVNPIWEPHIILCLSFSKLGLPGARTGVVIADESLIELITGSNAVFNLAPGRFGPTLLSRLTQNKTLIDICEQNIKPFYKNKVNIALDLVSHYFQNIPVKIHKPEGALFLWMWFQNLPISSEELYQKLKQKGVYVIAGHHFFPGLDEQWEHKHECIRVSYAGEPKKVELGIQIIADVVREIYQLEDKKACLS